LFLLVFLKGRLVSSLPSVTCGTLLTEKAIKLYEDLPPRSPFRQGYLHYFSAGQDAKELADVFGVSKQSIIAAQELEPEKNILDTLKYAPNVTRDKTTREEKSRIEEYWRDSTQAIPWKKTVTYKGKKSTKEKVRPKTFQNEKEKMNNCPETVRSLSRISNKTSVTPPSPVGFERKLAFPFVLSHS